MSGESTYVLVQRPGAEPERVVLDPALPCSMGRSQESTVVLTDASVSRRHAQIVLRDGAWWVEDLGSKNGTKLNSRRIDGPAELKPGDRVQLGTFQLVFSASETQATARVGDVERPATMRALSVEEFESGTDTRSSMQGLGPERMGNFLRAVDKIGQALLAHRPLDELFQFVVQLASEVLRADRTALLLREGAAGELTARAVQQSDRAAGDIVISRSIARSTIDQRQAILSSDAQSDTRFREQESVIQQRIHSAMCAPLWHDDDVLGILYVDNVAAPLPFEESDLRLLTLIAHLAAVKIRDTEQREAVEREQRLQEELKRAGTIQEALLPTDPLRRGRTMVAGRIVPSFDVGGDYFDFIDRDRGTLIVGLGDVAGKGMAAALLMTHLHATVRAQVETDRTLREIMGRLNRSIHQNVHGARFITLFLVEIDCERGVATYVNGGHNPPYLLRATGKIEMLATGGPLLGVLPEAGYEAAALTLGAGDVLLLYSDGVTEARSPEPAEEEFGDERLAAFLKENRELEPDELVESLIQRVRKFSGEGRLADDVTVVVIRFS
jgi:serine phosphatase RsbU (regulator of sigma subunit)